MMGKAAKKKAKAGKLPKRVLGVKIPKELRRTGEALIATAASPQGREMLATGLMAAASAALAKTEAGRTAAKPSVDEDKDVGAKAAVELSQIAAIATAAASAALDSVLGRPASAPTAGDTPHLAKRPN